MQMKESPNRFVGKWSLGRRMYGEFELDGENITVYKARFGKRALFGVGRIADGVLLLKFTLPDAMEEEAAFAAEKGVQAGQTSVSYSPVAESGGWAAAGSKELKGEVSIPDMVGGKHVVALKDHAFEGCGLITKIRLPAGIERIGKRAFFGCSSLENLSLPAGICRVPEYAFFGCGALEELMLPEGVIEIGSHAFEFCRSLKRIFIPASVKRIQSGAFWGCDSLEEVALSDLASWCAVEFEGSDANPFFRGAELCVGGKRTRFAEIPAGVAEIGSYAFAGSKLEGLRIPRSVKRIAPSAFEGCRALSRVIFGGTAGEWLAVEKAHWAEATGDFAVICTDGKVEKGGTLRKNRS